MAWSALCRNSLYIAFSSSSSQYAPVCVYIALYVFLEVLRLFFFFFFLLPSHLELLSQAFCKVMSCCASHLGLINFVTEIDST